MLSCRFGAFLQLLADAPQLQSRADALLYPRPLSEAHSSPILCTSIASPVVKSTDERCSHATQYVSSFRGCPMEGLATYFYMHNIKMEYVELDQLSHGFHRDERGMYHDR